MGDTVIVKGDEGDNGTPTPDPVAMDIAKNVGALESTTTQHAKNLEEHIERLKNLEEDKEWTKQQLNEIRESMANAPQIPIDLLENLTKRLEELESKTLSSAQSLTEAPPPIQSEPPKKQHGLSVLRHLI